MFESLEETSLCNKEIIWWTKVHYSTRWSVPQSKFCYQLAQCKCPTLHQKGKATY